MGWTFILFFVLCALLNIDSSAISDCVSDPKGINYRGNLSQTMSGRICKRWSTRWQIIYLPWPLFWYYWNLSDKPLDHNYCRNPGGLGLTAWCFTAGNARRPEYCAVGPFDPACNNSTMSEAISDFESDLTRIDYWGNLSQTVSNLTCQTWSTRWQNWPSFWYDGNLADETLDHNYCRNPSGLRSTAWCFTTDPEKRWEKCSVESFDSEFNNSTMSGGMTGQMTYALGMEAGRITDSAITASSEYNTHTRAAHGRLNKNFSWRPKEDEHSWIQP